MAEKPRRLTVAAEYATIASSLGTMFLLWMAWHSSGGGGDSTAPAQPHWTHFLMANPYLIAAGVLIACTATLAVLVHRANRIAVAPPSNLLIPPPDTYAGVLSPLQFDALRLAHDLLAFLTELGPQPNEMNVIEWRRIVRAKYALRFHAKAVNICQRLAEISLSDHHFANLVDSTDSPENVLDLAHTLRRMAFSAFGD